MEVCFPNSSVTAKSLRDKRELASLEPPVVNTTEEANVTFNIYADVQIQWNGKNLENQVFHSFISAEAFGFKSKWK